MDRRKFLSIASATGISLTSLGAFEKLAQAGARLGLSRPGAAAPLFITVNARGGWDPTALCDPKSGDIATTARGIRHASQFRRFFAKHDHRLLVINGVDLGTRNHEIGARHAWSGQSTEDYPGVAALVAAVHGRELPLGHLSFGGYDLTPGEVVRTREAPAAAFNPDRVDERADELAEFRGDELLELERRLPDLDTGDNPLIRQVQVALAAYRAGLTVAVNLELDGFDTHADHDDEHPARLAQLLAGLDFLVDEAARQGLADDYVVIVGSELGRSPGYNADGGKDHGAITSFMAFGRGIVGGRVVGATDDHHAPVGDLRITPRHLHHELRRLTGIDDDALVQRYPLAPAEDLRLLAGPPTRATPALA